MNNILLIFFAAIVTENIFFTQLSGVSPFLIVSGKPKTAVVFGLSTLITGVFSISFSYILNETVINKYDVGYIRFFVFAFIAALFTQLISNALMNADKALYYEMRAFMPYVTVNAVIIGAVITGSGQDLGFGMTVSYDIAYSAGFLFSAAAFSSVRLRMIASEPPKAFKGTPITLVAAGLVIMAFYGLSGMSFADAATTFFLKFKI